MKFDKIHNKGQAQIFRNKYLEYLTKTHPLVIWSIYLPVIVFLPYYAYSKLAFSGMYITVIFWVELYSGHFLNISYIVLFFIL